MLKVGYTNKVTFPSCFEEGDRNLKITIILLILSDLKQKQKIILV